MELPAVLWLIINISINSAVTMVLLRAIGPFNWITMLQPTVGNGRGFVTPEGLRVRVLEGKGGGSYI